MTQNELIQTHQERIANLPEISKYGLLLSTEDGSFITNISTMFTNKVSDIASAFVSNTTDLSAVDKKDHNHHAKVLLKLKGTVSTIVKEVEYDSVSRIPVPVMRGTHMSYLEQLEILTPAIYHVSNNAINILEECDTVLSNLIASRDFQKSSTPIKHPANLPVGVTMLNTAIDKIVNPKRTVDRLPIRELMHNMSSLVSVHEGCMNVGSVSSIKFLKELEAKSRKISTRVDDLHEVLVSGTVAYDHSRIVAMGDMLELAAKYLTSAITMIHITDQTIMSVTHLIKLVEEFRPR